MVKNSSFSLICFLWIRRKIVHYIGGVNFIGEITYGSSTLCSSHVPSCWSDDYLSRFRHFIMTECNLIFTLFYNFISRITKMHIVFHIYFNCCQYRSEIHEKMSCNRCQRDAVMPDDNPIADFNTQGLQPDQEDIGGFAGVAGCLHALRSSEKQVGLYFCSPSFSSVIWFSC